MAIHEKRVSEFVEQFRVEPGSKVTLAKDFDPGYKKGIDSKKAGRDLLGGGIEMLAEYQSRLYAEGTHGVLVVLQALDAAGKDGTIRHVMSGVNPQGVAVHSFKVPSSEELDQKGEKEAPSIWLGSISLQRGRPRVSAIVKGSSLFPGDRNSLVIDALFGPYSVTRLRHKRFEKISSD